MQIVLRHCNDDFGALMTATGMNDVGVDVFSVTDAGGQPFASSTGRFIVWGKASDSLNLDDMDAAIRKRKERGELGDRPGSGNG